MFHRSKENISYYGSIAQAQVTEEPLSSSRRFYGRLFLPLLACAIVVFVNLQTSAFGLTKASSSSELHVVPYATSSTISSKTATYKDGPTSQSPVKDTTENLQNKVQQPTLNKQDASNTFSRTQVHQEEPLQGPNLRFSVSTKYTQRGDDPVYSDYTWAAGPIVEPYQPTTLAVDHPVEGSEYSWTWEGHTYSGPTLQILVTQLGTKPVVLREVDAETGAAGRTLHSNVVVKYVKREIRALLEEDRNAFFDTLHYLLVTPEEVGKEVYGPDYMSLAQFVKMHLAYAADYCDHLHSGTGFINQHLGLNLMLEQAMQVVNPAVTIPYWDYTIDAHQVYAEAHGNFDSLMKISKIFDHDWFGSYDEKSFTLDEGRFGGLLKVETDWDFSVHNGYGMIRAPWNNNKNPLTQRFPDLSGTSLWYWKWPDCEDFWGYTQSLLPEMSSFVRALSSGPHGALHTLLGGVSGGVEVYDALEGVLEPEDLLHMRAHSFHGPKTLWRMGLFQCPESCEADAPVEECQCSCGSDEEFDRKLSDPDYLTTAWNYAKNLITTSYSDDIKKQVLKAVCQSGVLMGDQLEGSSPLDLIFWTIHPNIERLAQWRLLSKQTKELEWVESYWGSIQWGAEQSCLGHGALDVLPWVVKMDDGTTKKSAQYTNIEWFTYFNPTSTEYALPYVYENFDWEHCAEEGYYFR